MNFAYIAINVRNFNSKADFIQIYPVSEGYLRKIPVSRTVECHSPLFANRLFAKNTGFEDSQMSLDAKALGIFASPLNWYFWQIAARDI
jgi:hypothetical protein